ncbi:MAG: phosphate signaling complex protein PhoU [Porphyromonadaceae bacterium]|nr:phosphate signaling complex protein PhoU [Porphyromonadaceae bacterium]
MKYTEKELKHLSDEVGAMWLLVLSQLDKAQQAFARSDAELASEVLRREHRVDLYELQVDRASEHYIALYSPVAIDLRQILSLMAVARTLERIGDFAAGLAMHVLSQDCAQLPAEILERLQIAKMFATTQRMLTDCYTAYQHNCTECTRQILDDDQEVHAIYHEAPRVLAGYLQSHPEHIYCGMKLMLVIRKLERIGNHCSNIVEELVFYLDAQVLKHSRSTKRSEEN